MSEDLLARAKADLADPECTIKRIVADAEELIAEVEKERERSQFYYEEAFSYFERLMAEKGEITRLRAKCKKMERLMRADDETCLGCAAKKFVMDEQAARIKELEADVKYLRERWHGQSLTAIDRDIYIKRLEAAYLKAKTDAILGPQALCGFPLDLEEAEQKARDALEQIRAGGKDAK